MLFFFFFFLSRRFFFFELSDDELLELELEESESDEESEDEESDDDDEEEDELSFLASFLKRSNKYKVEQIYKDSLDLIPLPSTSVKIQIIGGKGYLR